jgi:FMN phosphatase YigB (HAD superfamily)
MFNRRYFIKSYKYLRNYGARAAMRRALIELRNLVRRYRGQAKLHTDSFDEKGYLEKISDPTIKLIIFDIFDTLITRPLLNPERTKCLVGLYLDRQKYVEHRHAAEEYVRIQARRDVSLSTIYSEYVLRYGNEDGNASELQTAEEKVELALAYPRPYYCDLMELAKREGKRVLLASDMFLSSDILRSMLKLCGIIHYDCLYVSSEVGVRKSTGELYHYILSMEKIAANKAVMVGDHPVSDYQIPTQLGLHAFLLESPITIANHHQRLASWLARARADAKPDMELWLGLIVLFFFNRSGKVFYDRASLTQGGRFGIGYAIVGPLLVAFSEWLYAKACEDRIDTLYFLAREGQLIKSIYETLYPPVGRTPHTAYLVLSRRAITVAMIRSSSDILDIARANYHSNSLHEFLYRRYGLILDEVTEQTLACDGIWPIGHRVSVWDRRVDKLEPVLKYLEPRILSQAEEERGPMLAYLESMGLNRQGKIALVDVGYAGTIQGRLCELLARSIHGYYLITKHSAKAVRERYSVLVESCFGRDLVTPEESPLLRYNVPLEMLMGSDDPQICRYHFDAAGNITAEFQMLSKDEHESSSLRQELRAGALAFAADYAKIKGALPFSLAIDPMIAMDMFKDFWEGISDTERGHLMSIAADDHYCGMGVVHFATFLPKKMAAA